MIPRLTETETSLPLYRAFCAELRARGFSGDLSERAADRTVMATDNSIYQLAPQAVAFPRDVDDLVRIARLLCEDRFREVRIAPRGGGTGTNGQSLTPGLVVDLSRYMNRILEIDPVGRTARVQTGVVKDQLNAALAPHGLFFAPELSTSNRATIGGMISTDACGQGSCLYGKTSDHVRGLATVLSDGTIWRSAPLEDEDLALAKAAPGVAGDIHRVLDRIVTTHAEAIDLHFPKLNRSLTGYDLAHVRGRTGRFDLNAILCGSEGTLGLLAEATLAVLPLPTSVALVNLRYDSFDAALRDASKLVAYGAASIETVDSKVLSLAQGDPVWEGIARFFPSQTGEPVRGVNLVEFVGASTQEVEDALQRLTGDLDREGASRGRLGHTIARGAHEVEAIWAMRKKSVGLLGNVKGDRRPIAFVEDVAVPPARLADFIAEFRAALDRRGLDYGMFGHVDAGVLHVRPAIDMKAPGAEALIREVTEEVVGLAQRYGGLLWGEHGKGMRSEFSPHFFGPLYPLLQEVKAAFDPRNQFNPGKIAVAGTGALIAIDAVPTKGSRDRAIPPSVRRGFDEALHCNGNGACFNWDPDEAMCPSWKGTRERRHSPKGRAQLMREWLRRLSTEGLDPSVEARALRRRNPILAFPSRLVATLWGGDDFSHEVAQSMSACLACKSCTGQCPIKVDVPTFRAKFLELYHGRYLRPVRHHLVARLEPMLPLLARFSALSNAITRSGALRLFGLVHTPALSRIDLRAALKARGVEEAVADRFAGLSPAERARNVVVVGDAFTTFYETQVLLDVLDLIRLAGVRPWLAPYRPNGKPLHVHGFLGAFERLAATNASLLDGFADAGVDLVGVDPSMTLTYRSEYAAALGDRPVPKVHLLQEWLATRLGDLPKAAHGTRHRFLPHCTERATAQGSLADWRRVFEAVGLELDVLASGCCGMAGTFGHEAEHRSLSETIYEQSWARHVRSAKADKPLLADGFSCRSQAAAVDGARLLHPARALLEALGGKDAGSAVPRLASAETVP